MEKGRKISFMQLKEIINFLKDCAHELNGLEIINIKFPKVGEVIQAIYVFEGKDYSLIFKKKNFEKWVKEGGVIEKSSKELLMSELKECPFCGDSAEIVELKHLGNNLYNVRCTSIICGAHRKNGFYKKIGAILDWNTRYTPPVLTNEQ